MYISVSILINYDTYLKRVMYMVGLPIEQSERFRLPILRDSEPFDVILILRQRMFYLKKFSYIQSGRQKCTCATELSIFYDLLAKYFAAQWWVPTLNS